MSAYRQWIVECDAEKVGLPMCLHRYVSDATSLIDVRRNMRLTAGWVRKMHGGIAVDLCYLCAQKTDPQRDESRT